MIKVYFFGTAGARSYADRDNSYLGIEAEDCSFFIDCAGAPVHRARHLGFPWLQSRGVIITHLHPDHHYGLPSLLHNLRLYNRQAAFKIWCLPSDVEQLQSLLRIFGFYPEFSFPIDIIAVDVTQKNATLELGPLLVQCFPTQHGVASMGVSMTHVPSGKHIVYSSDSRPAESTLQASRQADLLIHEASFLHENLDLAEVTNHSTAYEAGRLAASAQANALYLIHCYSETPALLQRFVAEAKSSFAGPVTLSQDLSVIEL